VGAKAISSGELALGVDAAAWITIYRIGFYPGLNDSFIAVLAADPPPSISSGPVLSVSPSSGVFGTSTAVTIGGPTASILTTTVGGLFCPSQSVGVVYSPNLSGGTSLCSNAVFNSINNSLSCTVGADVPVATPVALSLTVSSVTDAADSTIPMSATFTVSAGSILATANSVWNFTSPPVNAGWSASAGGGSGVAVLNGISQYIGE
jgi:hypothetical protein